MYQLLLQDNLNYLKDIKLLNENGFVDGFCDFFKLWIELKDSWSRLHSINDAVIVADWILVSSRRNFSPTVLMKNVIADKTLSRFFPVTSWTAVTNIRQYLHLNPTKPLYFLMYHGCGVTPIPYCTVGIVHPPTSPTTNLKICIYEPRESFTKPCSSFRYIWKIFSRSSSAVFEGLVDKEYKNEKPVVSALKFIAKALDAVDDNTTTKIKVDESHLKL